jgi:hypothetical protein
MTSSERPPRSAERPEGDPPGEDQGTTGRTPHTEEPAEGGEPSGTDEGADSPD